LLPGLVLLLARSVKFSRSAAVNLLAVFAAFSFFVAAEQDTLLRINPRDRVMQNLPLMLP
jgi:hypothetical protein